MAALLISGINDHTAKRAGNGEPGVFSWPASQNVPDDELAYGAESY